MRYGWFTVKARMNWIEKAAIEPLHFRYLRLGICIKIS